MQSRPSRASVPPMKRLALALVLAAACGGGGTKKTDTTPTTDTTTTTPTGGAVELELGELKLIDVSKNKALLVHADGTIELDGQKPAKVTKDGKIAKIDTGEVGFTLNADGTISGPDGKSVGVTLAADGTLTSGDKKISVDDAGKLVGANPAAPEMKIEGASTPGLKRTAMFVLVALTTPGETKASSSAGGAP